MSTLMVVWGVATTILVALLIYRALLSLKEEDRLFLTKAEEHEEAEQQKLIGKLRSVGRYSLWFGILSGVLMLAIAGMWTYEQFMRPPIA
jgi:hypothetical protein